MTCHHINYAIIGSDARLLSYSDGVVASGGKTSLLLDKDRVSKLECELVDANVVPILGLEAFVGLDIVKRADTLINQAVLDDFADCFEGIGCVEREYTVQVDPLRARHKPLSKVEKGER